MITYHHRANMHSIEGAARGLECLLQGRKVSSLLDVGAGIGNWLMAAQNAGIDDVLGVDGILPDDERLCVPRERIILANLEQPLNLGRTFDVALCLEVAEHLSEAAAATLIASLCRHSPLIYFSAAAPGQRGQHHVNCQTPAYWQTLFNAQGYSCSDNIRMKIWEDDLIEPWYRQNLFLAKCQPELAGGEQRIPYLVHPEMVQFTDFETSRAAEANRNLLAGALSPTAYLKCFGLSVSRRVRARLKSVEAGRK